PPMSPGEYQVELSNDDGQTWIPTDNRISIRAPSADPLRLGLGWASEFAWQRVTEPAAKSATATDDTERVQRALDSAAASGGGVVRLPPGELSVRALRIGRGVVLVGAPHQRTTLRYVGSGGTMLSPTPDAAMVGGFGIADLKIVVAPNSLPPDLFVQL